MAYDVITTFTRDPFDIVPEDNATAAQPAVLGRQRELLVGDLLPSKFNMNRRSKLFIGNQLPAGVAPALWSATTQQCGLFNPLGSGVNAVLVKMTATYVSGTGVVNGLALGYKTGCGATIATAAPVITAATLITPIALNMSGATAACQFMSAGITTAAPSYLMRLGVNNMVVTAATTSIPPYLTYYDFDGDVIIPPGGAIFVGADITGITAVYAISLMWAEVKP